VRAVIPADAYHAYEMLTTIALQRAGMPHDEQMARCARCGIRQDRECAKLRCSRHSKGQHDWEIRERNG
jgi:hypothetical protein